VRGRSVGRARRAALLALCLGSARGAVAEDLPDPRVDTVVVAGSHQPLALSALSGSADVITGEELRAGRYADVAEALRHRVGLHVDAPGIRASRASVYTRGLDPNHTLVLVDGVPVNDPTNARGGSFDLSTLGTEDIDRIEIVRGPISAVHGSGALGGAIQIFTRDGRGPDRASLDGAVDAHWGGVRSAAAVGGERGPIDATLAGAVDEDGEPGDDLGDFSRRALSGSLGADLPGETRARGTLRLSRSKSATHPEFSGGEELAVRRDFERRDVSDLVGGLEVTSRPLEALEATLASAVFLRQEDRSSPGVAPSTGNPIGVPAEPDTTDRLRRSRTSLHVTGDAPLGASLTVGGDVEWEHGESRGVASPPFGAPDFSERRVVGGAYAETQWRGGGFSLLAGARVDFREDGSPVWTPRATGTWTVAPLGVVLHAGYGRGFKLPSFYALGSLVGNPELRPERSEGFDAGLVVPLLSGAVELSATAFHERVRELIDFDPVAFRLENLDRVISRGVEGEVWIRLGADVEARGHVTYAETEDQDGRRLRNRPEWRGGGVLTWRFGPGFAARGEVLTVGSVDDASVPTAPAIVRLAPWLRADVSLAWTPREWLELSVALENVTDERTEEAIGFRAPGIRPWLGVRLGL